MSNQSSIIGPNFSLVVHTHTQTHTHTHTYNHHDPLVIVSVLVRGCLLAPPGKTEHPPSLPTTAKLRAQATFLFKFYFQDIFFADFFFLHSVSLKVGGLGQ